MPLTLTEMPGRKSTKNVSTGILQYAEMRYVVYQDINDAAVRSFLDQNLPKKYETTLFADTYDLEERTDDPGVWNVLAKFKLPEDQQQNQDAQPVKLQFSTGGGSKHLKYSLRTIDSGKIPKGNPDTALPQQGAINVSEDSVEGTDVPCPNLEFGYTYKVKANTVDTLTVHFMTAKVNSNVYRGFPPGSLLFMGVDGTIDLAVGGELTYKFAARPNLVNQHIGTGNQQSKAFAVDGWDYVWCRVDKRPAVAPAVGVVNVPTNWYVERTLERADFNLLGIL